MTRNSFRLLTLLSVSLLLGLSVIAGLGSHARASLGPDVVISPLARTIDSLRAVTSRLDNQIHELVGVDSSMARRLALPVVSAELRANRSSTNYLQQVTFAPQHSDPTRLESRIDQQHRYIELIMGSIDGRRQLADHLPTLTPTIGKYTSSFGYRVHPISGRMKMHEGIDLSAPTGTPIRAAGDGVVSFAARRNGYGNTLELQHAFGYATLYGHCSRLLVKEGDTVSRGQIVALVGSTGASTGPHLHYEVMVDGTKVAPDGFLIDEPVRPAQDDVSDAPTLTGSSPRKHGRKTAGRHVGHRRSRK